MKCPWSRQSTYAAHAAIAEERKNRICITARPIEAAVVTKAL